MITKVTHNCRKKTENGCVCCFLSARDATTGTVTTDTTLNTEKVTGCQCHMPQYTQGDVLYIIVPPYVNPQQEIST